MAPRKLNVFQRVMLLWDQVHPYNAAQVLHLEGTTEPAKLATAWEETLSVLGLRCVRVDGSRFHYVTDRNCGVPPPRVVDATLRIDDVLTQEMNTPFRPGDSTIDGVCPFRAFVQVGNGTYYIGIIYHHWVADSASIRVLLRDWFMRSHGLPGARTRSLDIPLGGYWRFFGPDRARWGLTDGLLHTLRASARFSNARQIPDGRAGFHVRYSMHPLPDGAIDALHSATRRRGVTLHDLFMAAIAIACDRFGVTPPSPGRQELALGTIVDLRSSSREEMSDVFGLFLGFTTCHVRPPLNDLDRLIRSLSVQNAWQKKHRTAESSLLRMAAGLAQAQILSAEQRLTFYRKFMPMAAGISNVNMNRSWAAEYFPSPLLNYLRVSPTGPMLPLVFTTTTVGSRFHVALTRRDDLIDDRRAAALVSTFIEQLGVAAAWK